MRTFLELLPYRIEQAMDWSALRAARVRWKRKAHKPATVPAPEGQKRLFIDLAIISNHDAGTGIQRVVRALAVALLEQSSGRANEQWDIRFVSARRKKRYYRISWPERPINMGDGEEMRGRPGDVFLGLDYSLDAVRRHRGQLAQFQRDGGSLWFLVHDLLPLNRPEWFSRNTVIRYKAWLGILAGIADGFFSNSPQTDAELKEALAKVYGLSGGYRTQVLPMGHALIDAKDAVEPTIPRFDVSTPFVLMVGTLEPRKGHGDMISAFEELWRKGSGVRLVFVGRLGWQVEALHDRILRHPKYGTLLLWLNDVDDAELASIYMACTGVIIASHAEGFGLPLIEALGHGKPVLARDLPVFRMHDGKGVHFFPAKGSPNDLADATQHWIEAAQGGEVVVERPTKDWRDSARMLLETLGSTP